MPSFFSASLPSLRILRMATLLSSAFFLTSFARSFLRSSVSSGNTRRITLPSLDGLMPISDVRMAFSIALIRDFSQGAIWMTRASGTVTLPTCWMGVGVP